jgi:hypothetical protein
MFKAGSRLMLCAAVLLPFSAAHAQRPGSSSSLNARMNQIAEQYVKLVLAVGQHDADYVDAFYGPKQWQTQAAAEKKPLATIRTDAEKPLKALDAIDVSKQPELVQLRKQYLHRQLEALISRVEILQGKKLTFDEEARALYDADPPRNPDSHFQQVLDKLNALLPGSAPLVDRVATFKRDFIIPKEKLDTVFRAAVAESRRRTKQHMKLPANESFVIEYVRDKPWSGYNWYKGSSHSLIQVNTDLPIYIDRAIDLAAHEGYPGHHVYNALLEQHLVKERGWVEYSVYPLFSPQSLIAEGSANFGIDVAFPGAEKAAFERKVLFPLAGIDPAKVDKYEQVQRLVGELSYADNEAARRYLNGEIDRDAAARWLATYALSPLERAQQRIRFYDKYRSYVINYNLGRDLVRQYVEKYGGTESNPARRWEVFMKLLSSPRLPSGLG